MLKQVALFLLLLACVALPASAQNDGEGIFAIDWTPDGQHLVARTSLGILLYDTQDFSAPPRLLEGTEAFSIPDIAIDQASGNIVVVPDYAQATVIIYDTASAQPLDEQPPIYPGDIGVIDVAVRGDGNDIAIANVYGMYMFSLPEGNENPAAYNLPSGSYMSVSYSPDNSSIAASDFDGNLFVMRTRQAGPNTRPRQLSFDHTIQEVAFSPDGRYLGALGLFNPLHLLDVRSLDLLPLPEEMQTTSGSSFDFSPDSQTLAYGKPGIILLYNIAEEAITSRWEFAEDDVMVFDVEYSPDGGQIASIDTRGTLLIWDVESGEIVQEINDYTRGFDMRWG
jgi:WD40 repeat protein